MLSLHISKNQYFEVKADNNHYVLEENTSTTPGTWHNYHKNNYISFDLEILDQRNQPVSGDGLMLEVMVRYSPTMGTNDVAGRPYPTTSGSENCRQDVVDIRPESDVVFEASPSATKSSRSSSSSSSSVSSSSSTVGSGQLQRRRFYLHSNGKGNIRFRLTQLSSSHGGRLFQLVVVPVSMTTAAGGAAGGGGGMNTDNQIGNWVASEPVKVKARNTQSKTGRSADGNQLKSVISSTDLILPRRQLTPQDAFYPMQLMHPFHIPSTAGVAVNFGAASGYAMSNDPHRMSTGMAAAHSKYNLTGNMPFVVGGIGDGTSNNQVDGSPRNKRSNDEGTMITSDVADEGMGNQEPATKRMKDAMATAASSSSSFPFPQQQQQQQGQFGQNAPAYLFVPAVDVPNNPQAAASMSALNASIFHLIADALPNVMAAIETLQKQTVVHPTTASGREDKHKYILSASSVDVLLSAVMNFRGLASAVVSASSSLRGAAGPTLSSTSSCTSAASSCSSSNTTTATSIGIDIQHQAAGELRIKTSMDVTDDQTEVTAGSSSSTRATISSYLEQLQLQRQHHQQQHHAYHSSSGAVADMNGAYLVYPYETALQVAQNRASMSTQPLIRSNSTSNHSDQVDGHGQSSNKSKSDKSSEDSNRDKIPILNISDKSLEYLVHLQDHRGDEMLDASTSSRGHDADFDGTARSNISGVTSGLASRREEEYEPSFAVDALSHDDDVTVPTLLTGKDNEMVGSSAIGETVQTRTPRIAMVPSGNSTGPINNNASTEVDGEKFEDISLPDVQGKTTEEEGETVPAQQQQQQQQQPYSDAAGVLLTLGLGTSKP